MIFFIGSVKSKYFCKKDLIDSYNEYYEQQFQGQCFEAKKMNFIVFDNNEDYEKLFYEQNEVGVYGDLVNAFFKVNNDDINIYERIAYEYKQKDIDFLKELSGDFSFVLVDYIKERIFLVRDQFGIKQLFWYRDSNNIFFSNFLFSMTRVYIPNIISSKFLEKYYCNNGLLDFSLTPYKDVFRVNISSFIEIDNEKLHEIRYWTLYSEEMIYETEDEWIKKIDELIKKSISKRNKKKMGIMLSGGLDSTTLFTYYTKLKDTTIEGFSAVFDKLKSCDERLFIDELLKQYPGEQFNYVNCDDAGIFEGCPQSLFYTSEPHVNIINKALSEKLFAEAQRNRYRYMVDGFFGDHIFNGNIHFIMDEINNRQYIKAFRTMRTYAEKRNKNVWKVFIEEVLPIKKMKMYGIADNVIAENIKSLNKIKKYNNIDMIIQIRSAIARNFGDFELAPRYGIECIHPYVDTELVNALYNMPGELKCHGGIYKYILRKVVNNRLPQIIVQRVVKTEHVELSQRGLLNNWGKIYNILKEGRICKLKFFHLTNEQWRDKLIRFRSGEELNDVIWVLMSIEIWLYQIELKYGTIKFEE